MRCVLCCRRCRFCCSTTISEGVGAALSANGSTVILANSTVVDNAGTNIGGCAIHATNPQGTILAGCTFGNNTCRGDGRVLVAGSYAASSCVAGGASLYVASDMSLPKEGKVTSCNGLTKHLVHISDTSFAQDRPTRVSCGGSIGLKNSWLELQRSSIVGNGDDLSKSPSKGSAVASIASMIVVQDAKMHSHNSLEYGGCMFQLRGRFLAAGSTFRNCRVLGGAQGGDCGGALFLADTSEAFVSGCDFASCSATYGGGAIYNQVLYETFDDRPPVTIHATRISNCTAKRDGGGKCHRGWHAGSHADAYVSHPPCSHVQYRC